MMTPHYPHHTPTYHKNIHGSVEPRLSLLYHTMIPLLVLITLVLSAHGKQFPLEVPPPVKPYFDYLRNTTSSNHLANVTREPKYLVEDINFKESQRLSVPEALVDFYNEKKAVRSGRQIVPGVYSCGHQGKDQFINFINPHYPSHDNVAGTCHFRMVTAEPGVCQVRVDFVDTELQSPIEGDCDDQYLIISGSTWSTGFNKLCGINPDQHFYIHLDKHIGFQHVDFTITSVSTNVPYKFGLWITQIDCFDGSSVMAPGGCTQFHFGMEGIIKSFNFEGVQYLNNQNYKSCIRSERGSCFVEFQADANHFMLEPIEVDDYEARKRKKAASTSFFGSAPRSKKKKIYSRPNAKAGDSSCMEDYLLIPGGQDSKEQTEVEHSHDR